jgi:hypothetical protein
MVEILAMCLSPKIVFPFKKLFLQKVLPNLVERTKQEYAFVKTCKMLFCHYKFGLIDVKKSI